ncbi:hypothetical protein SCFA_3510004 [anaerobic digester metagenome]|jgi:hypothetical protein|uniref:Uncharacterized protein n=1 Tax=anaerobic digester metagenome TaxID=1263854 RepID=A0A485M344_9ZZZZ
MAIITRDISYSLGVNRPMYNIFVVDDDKEIARAIYWKYSDSWFHPFYFLF